MSIGNYAENKLLDTVFNATAYSVATPYVSLHSSDTGETGANEISGGSYVRKAASFAAAADGECVSDADLEFTGMPAVTVTHVGVWDHESAGNFLWGGALTAQKTTNAGDTFKIESGDLVATLD
jgi:hypothetical protein